MTTLAEIESAAATLSHSDQKLLLEHLQIRLRQSRADERKENGTSSKVLRWPDYHARLRTIYGDQPMLSMVVAERDSAPW
jgi:hypothetical protein